jgi:NAD+ diphosphatase
MAAFDGDGLWALDRAGHLRKDLAALEGELSGERALLLPMWRDLNLLADGRIALLEIATVRDLLRLDGELVFLGMLSATGCFAIDLSAHGDPLELPALRGRGEFLDLRRAGPALPADQVGLAAYARGLLHWHRRARHCGVCGAATAPRDGGHLRVCRQEDCRAEIFPRTDPAVIMLVAAGDRCLLGRQKIWPRGMYSTLAGFVEPGETLEQAVAREVLEESGVQVDEVRYFRSQPWPFPASLMLGFTAIARTEQIAISDELEDARWFSRADLERRTEPPTHGQGGSESALFVPGPFSLSGQLIAAFLQGERP